MKLEKRSTQFEYEPSKEKTPVLRGYAARYNSETIIEDSFYEVIRPGAFTRALEEGQDVIALFNHDWNIVLGRRSAGTLKLEETPEGLQVEVIPPENSTGQYVKEAIERGDIKEMSFSFRVAKETWEQREDLPLRSLEDLDLIDISFVSFPAYASTSAEVGYRTAKEVCLDCPLQQQEDIKKNPSVGPQPDITIYRARIALKEFEE